MTRSLAEELLLLVLDDHTGTTVLDHQRLQAALAGAVVTQLVLDGVLEIADIPDVSEISENVETDSETTTGRLRRRGAAAPLDRLMDEIVDRAHGRRPQDAVSCIGVATAWGHRAGSLKEQLLHTLAEDGVVVSDRARIFGLFPTTTWKPQDGVTVSEIRERVLAVLHGRNEPDARTGALISLLAASGIVPRVFPDEDGGTLTARAHEVSDQGRAGEAVRRIIHETRGLIGAIIVGTVVSSSAGPHS